MKDLYHYTYHKHISQTIENGCIKLAPVNIPEREKPAVFISYDQLLDRTCSKNLQTDWSIKLLTFQEMAEGGIFRIAIKRQAAPYDVH